LFATCAPFSVSAIGYLLIDVDISTGQLALSDSGIVRIRSTRSLVIVTAAETIRRTKVTVYGAFRLGEQKQQTCRKEQQQSSRHQDWSCLQMRRLLLCLRSRRTLKQILHFRRE